MTRNTTIIPALVLAGTILLGGCTTTKQEAAIPDTAFRITTTPYPQLQGPNGSYGGWWKDRFEEKCKLAQDGGFEVMFIGDSITHGIERPNGVFTDNGVFKAMLAPVTVGNFGFSGDRTEHVLWRLDHGHLAGKINPKVVMLMIGTNNTGHRMDPPADIALGIEAIVNRVTSRFPQAQVLLLAIFPRNAKPGDAMRVNNEKTNQLIAKLDGSAAGRVHYLDLTPKFLDASGNLPASLMPDFLHPNAAGYKIWAEAVVPEIKDILVHKPLKG